jgi:K+ transporter
VSHDDTDYEPALVQFSAENAELERLRIRSERMELMARAVETLAQSRELLIKADEALARSWPYTSANGPSRTDTHVTDYFRLPTEQVVEIGRQISI